MIPYKYFWCVSILSLGFSLSGCDRLSKSSSLEEIRSRGTLVVLTRNAPTTYYEGRDGLMGLEYEMAEAFGEHLGVKVGYKTRDTLAGLLDGLAGGEGDMAAAGLTKTAGRLGPYIAGPVYQTVRQQVVCRRGGVNPGGLEELAGIELTVVAGSSYVDRLIGLKKKHPDLRWVVSEEDGTEELLEKVWEKKIPCTVGDSNIVAINRRYYPELVVSFDLTSPEPLVWYFTRSSRKLRRESKIWFEKFEAEGNLDLLLEKYYGFIEVFDYVDTRVFTRAVEKDLPGLRPLFQKAAAKNGIPWTLLAAQSYQESHWKPHAKSPTGVKGLMMLTLPTAREMGVNNRLDAEQSLKGGVKYLSRLRSRLPEEVVEPDRTWMALAAYNVGMGHLQDARALAVELGKDPDRWSDISEVLPLLSQKKYYRKLQHGYARGLEPVLYVNRIRDYRDILEKALGK